LSTAIGLDLGSKTVGVALSASGVIASPLETVRFPENDMDKALAAVCRLIDVHEVKTVVLGYPKHMNNDVGPRAKVSESFKESLEAARPVKVILWDERLSSSAANRAMLSGDLSRRDRKDKKDSLAAVIILQNWLDSQRRNKP
jgi:putative holliday junction resolvase